MPEKRANLLEEIRKWAMLTMISIILFAGKAQVREIVREEVGMLRDQVRQLELKVAAIEARKEIKP